MASRRSATGESSLSPRIVSSKDAEYPVTLDPTVSGPTTVTNASTTRPSVAFDGTHFLVVFVQNTSEFISDIFAVQVQGDGSRVQAVGAISDTTDARDDDYPDVAWNGSKFLVVWEHSFGTGDQDIQGRRVDAAGFPLGGVLPISDAVKFQQAPEVAAGGSTFYVVWEDDSPGNFDIVGARVTTGGALLDGLGVRVTTNPNNEFRAHVAWNGTTFLVTYELHLSNADIYARRVNTSAAPVGDPIPVAAADFQQYGGSVASNGTDFLVVWEDNRNNPSDVNGFDIFGARVTGSGAVLDSHIDIAVTALDELAPVVAFNGSYLVVWMQEPSPSFFDVYARRVRSDGSLQDPNSFAIAAAPGIISEDIPTVAAAPGSGTWAVDYTLANFGNGDRALVQRIASK